MSRDALTRFLARQPVSGLVLRRFSGGADAGFLRGQSSLRSLEITVWPELRDLSALHGLPLEDVTLDLGNDVPLGRRSPPGPGCVRSPCTRGRVRGPSPTSPRGPLEALHLDDADPDLAGLGRLTSLRRLWLGRGWRPSGKAAWAELSALAGLEEIAVHTAALAGLAAYAHLPALRTVMVYDDEAWDSALRSQVARSFPEAALKPVTQAYEGAYEE